MSKFKSQALCTQWSRPSDGNVPVITQLLVAYLVWRDIANCLQNLSSSNHTRLSYIKMPLGHYYFGCMCGNKNLEMSQVFMYWIKASRFHTVPITTQLAANVQLWQHNIHHSRLKWNSILVIFFDYNIWR